MRRVDREVPGIEFELRDLPSRARLEEVARQFPEADVTAIESCLAFLRVAADVQAAFDLHYSRHGLSQGKFNLLMLLFRNPAEGLPPSELAERAGVTRGTITGLLDGLERSGLVEREDHPEDRRMVKIRLTARGLDLLHRILPDQYRRTAGLMAGLTEPEREQLVALLTKIRTGITALTEP